jgi:3-hydroxyacyl-[acyl-carrier-protein] dehydratase
MSQSEQQRMIYPNPDAVEEFHGRVLDVEAIMELLPHRPPFLLVDRIIELEPAERAVGIKCVTINEPFFAGHFPGHPVMPGVLILEAMAQVAGIVTFTGIVERNQVAYFTGVSDAKFRNPVRPGDVLRLEATSLNTKYRFGKLISWFSMTATVDDNKVAEANCSFALIDSSEIG